MQKLGQKQTPWGSNLLTPIGQKHTLGVKFAEIWPEASTLAAVRTAESSERGRWCLRRWSVSEAVAYQSVSHQSVSQTVIQPARQHVSLTFNQPASQSTRRLPPAKPASFIANLGAGAERQGCI